MINNKNKNTNMKLNTIGDLRNLLKDNDGEIKIGELTISTELVEEGESDIDFKYDGVIIMWISSGQEQTLNLSEAHVTKMHAVFADKDRKKEMKIEIAELKSKIESFEQEKLEFERQTEVLQSKIKQSSLSEGMVVAYEKLLLGRGLTIGQ